MKQKYYVVWVGRDTGIFHTWEECRANVEGYKGAKYKAFDSEAEAKAAFCDEDYLSTHAKSHATTRTRRSTATHAGGTAAYMTNSLAVDAACSGNPGPMEYRGVYVATGKEVFRFGPVFGTNNIGEFLAIVHGLALLKQKRLDMPIYSDSRNAMLWIKQKKCKTKLERNARTEQLFQMIERAEKWLHDNTYDTDILKWDTRRWGEIPADYGRK